MNALSAQTSSLWTRAGRYRDHGKRLAIENVDDPLPGEGRDPDAQREGYTPDELRQFECRGYALPPDRG
jgi:hypothetical protein